MHVNADQVKVRLVQELARYGVQTHTELKLPALGRFARAKRFPVDVAVLKHGEVVAVAEAKRWSPLELNKRQRANYVACGFPAVIVIPDTIHKAADALANFVLADRPIPTELLIGAKYGAKYPTREERRMAKAARVQNDKKFHHEILELAGDWCRAYGGLASIPQIGRFCKPLLEKYPFSQVQVHWLHYLRETPGKFASPSRFSLTFGTWAPPTHSVVRVPYQRTPDECDRAAGIKLPGEP